MTRLLTLRAFVHRRFAVVVLVAVLLACLGAWGVYATHVSSNVQTEERPVASWSATADHEHRATVVNGSEAFPEGSTVANRSLYFTGPMPALESTYVYRYDASSGDLRVETTLEVIVRSADDGEVYWRITDTVGERVSPSLAPGERHEFPHELDVERTLERTQRVEEDLDASPGSVEVYLLARTSVEGTVEGERVEDTVEHPLGVVPGESTYRVESTPEERTYDVRDRVVVDEEPRPLRSGGPAVLLVVSLVWLAVLSGARGAGVLLPPEERRDLDHARERERFDDWISRGTLPDDVLARPSIEVQSLEGLVDVAVDSDRRVVEEPTEEAFYVVDGDVTYVYRPSASDGSLEVA